MPMRWGELAVPRTLCEHPEDFPVDLELIEQYKDAPLDERVDALLRWSEPGLRRSMAEWNTCSNCMLRFVAAAETMEKSLRLLHIGVSRPSLPAAVRKQVIARHKHQCLYCGGKGNETHGPVGKAWHIDHFQPVAKGGTDDISNLVLACARCNGAKHTATFAEFVERRWSPLQKEGGKDIWLAALAMYVAITTEQK